GELRSVVLRQFDNLAWLEEEPDLARHEAEALKRAAAVLGERAPQIIAYDETGEAAGMPSVLMTRLEGAVELLPQTMTIWLDGLAEAIACVHVGGGAGTGADVIGSEFAWRYFAYYDVERLVDAQWTWSQAPDMWR